MNKPLQADGRVHGAIVGCRRDDGRWLLIRRSRHIALAPLKICFPGGTLEPDESHEDAARREFLEELGVPVQLIRHVWHCVFEDKPLTLWGYLGEPAHHAFTPDPQEVEETLWMTAEEVAAHPDVLPRTTTFIRHLEAAVDQ